MALPRIVTPEFDTQIPSTQQEIRYRPFLVKEEKVLFMAMESQDTKAIANAMNQVLSNCIIEPTDINYNALAAYDVEYLFLQLRSKSVGENIKVTVHHPGWDEEGSDICKYAHEVEIPIEDVKIEGSTSSDPIMITDTMGLIMRHPTMMDMTTAAVTGEPSMDQIMEMMYGLVVNVFDDKEVYDQFSHEEITEFFDSLNQAQFEKVLEHFQNMPQLRYEVKWTCPSCGKEDSVMLEGLTAFFT